MITRIDATKDNFNKDLVSAIVQLGLTAEQVGELASHYLNIIVNGDCRADLKDAMYNCDISLSLTDNNVIRNTAIELMTNDNAVLPYYELQSIAGAVNYLLANHRDTSNVKKLVVGDNDLYSLHRVARTALGLRQCDLAKLLSKTANVPYEASTITTFIGRIEDPARLKYVPVRVTTMLVDALNNFLSDVKLIDLKSDLDKKEKAMCNADIGLLTATRNNLISVDATPKALTKLIMFYHHFSNEDRLQVDMRDLVKDKTSSVEINGSVIENALTSVMNYGVVNGDLLEIINVVACHLATYRDEVSSLNNMLFPRLNHRDPSFIDTLNAIMTILCLRKTDLVDSIQHHIDVSVSSSVINKALTALNENVYTTKVTDSVKSMIVSGVNSLLEEWGFVTKMPKQKPSKGPLVQLCVGMVNLDKHLQNALTALDLTPSQLAILLKDTHLKLIDVDMLNRYVGNLLLGLSPNVPSMNIIADAVCSTVNTLLINAGLARTVSFGNRLERSVQRSKPITEEKPIDEERNEVTRVRDAVYGFRVSDVHGETKVEPYNEPKSVEPKCGEEDVSIRTFLTNIVKCNAVLHEQNQQLAKEIKELRSDVQRLTESVNVQNKAQPWSGFNQNAMSIKPQNPKFDGYCNLYRSISAPIAVEWNPNPNASGSFGRQVVSTPTMLLSVANQHAELDIHVHQSDAAYLQYVLANKLRDVASRCTVFVRT